MFMLESSSSLHQLLPSNFFLLKLNFLIVLINYFDLFVLSSFGQHDVSELHNQLRAHV